MSATSFNTRNDSYRKLLGNGLTYRIPRFQRDYSWGEEEWDDLWLDILGTLTPDGEPAHYMGYLVLQSSDDRLFEVIDGQQRLTTLSLIVLGGLRILKRGVAENKDAERNHQRMTQIRASYIGYLDPVTLVSSSKLSLNRNNDDYYQRYLVPLEDRLPQRGFPASVHTMRKAFEWFEKRLRDYVKDTEDPGMAVAQFIEAMSDKLFFTVITVADELNAYQVFETLNARGVRLSATDLLKNYLFSVLHRGSRNAHEMDELEHRWESMVGRLGSESFPDFLRMHWNSRESFARQSELFKVIRSRINTREKVFDLLRAMDEDIDTYLALTQPEGSQWPPPWREQARELRMFSVRQPFSMLMAAHRKLPAAEYERLLRATVSLAFRYNVIGGQHTGDQERVYHGVAFRIARDELRRTAEILDALRAIYLNDEAFRVAFTDKTIKTTVSRNRKVVRYILCQLEKQASGSGLRHPAYPQAINPSRIGAPAGGGRSVDSWSEGAARSNATLLDDFFRSKAIQLDRSALFDRHLTPKPSSFDFERVEGMLLGLAIGDALGITSEGMFPSRRRARYGELRDYIPNRYVNEVRGFPSDDTQLAFWTLEQLIQDRRFVPAHVAARFASSGRIYGIGATVRDFLDNLKRGLPWHQSGPKSAGNGALMRIAPILVPYLRAGGTGLWVDTALAAMMTHNQRAAVSSCLAFVAMLWELLDMSAAPARGWWRERYVELARDLEGATACSPRGGQFSDYSGPLWRFVAKTLSWAEREDLSVLAACDGWRSGAYLLETVPSVLYILMRHADDPEEAIVRAINDTKDNDTIAAIVGAAVGALHGRKGIPERWIQNLSGRTSDREDDGHVFDLIDRARSLFWLEETAFPLP